MSEPGIPEQPDEATRTTPAATLTMTETAAEPETTEQTSESPAAPGPETDPEAAAETVTGVPAPAGPGRSSAFPRTLPALAPATLPVMAPVAPDSLEPAPALEDVPFPFPQRSAPGKSDAFFRRLFRRR